MKKIILTLLGVVLLAPSLKGQTTKTISLNFNENDFELIVDGGRTTISSSKYDLIYKHDTISPALPYIAVNYLIGPNETYNSVSSTNVIGRIYTSINLINNPSVYPNENSLCGFSSDAENQTSKKTYNNEVSILPPRPNLSYPKNNVEHIYSNSVEGYNIETFYICPFQYSPILHALCLLTQINLTITVEVIDSLGVPSITPSYAMAQTQDIVKSLTLNGDELDSLYSDALTGPQMPSLSDSCFDYLIITKDSLKTSFQKLADWKTTTGVKTKVISTADIYASYQDLDYFCRIKRAIKYYRDNYGVKYVLLGGDISMVPALSAYCYYEKGEQTYTFFGPADIFYSCLGKIEWDSNNNMLYGELEDGINLVPLISVTRIPVNNNIEARIVIDKIINYEKNPPVDFWNNNILMGGSNVSGRYEIDSVGHKHSDSECFGNILYGKIQSYGWQGDRKQLYDTYSDFPEDTINVNPDILQEQLSHGYPFVHIGCHGSYRCWAINGYYDTTYATHLQNTAYTVITTSACNTNAFDQSGNISSLGETFLRSPTSGVIAYLGCSRQSWNSNNFKNLSFTDLFVSHFYKGLFSSKWKSYGDAVFYMRMQNCYAAYSEELIRWLLYGFNPLGDAEMPIYTSCPIAFQNVQINSSGDTISVSTGIDSCRICLTSEPDCGEAVFEVINDVSSAMFVGKKGCFNVCVTKPGYIPSLWTVYTDCYVQNENFNENKHIKAKNVYIGSNVTFEEEGPVSVNDGKFFLEYTNQVLIKNDFEVKPHAEFEIKTIQP